ncbi:hypothetical protein ACRALDRAFT_207662 [Sodiomyces alcalophilus JCM 7366]|uniref:uncharacterized protein n=1 Tax=Sodiomyces alcalophilus JCM 7366 TaxID=591952 RepID=UPI0039B66CA8
MAGGVFFSCVPFPFPCAYCKASRQLCDDDTIGAGPTAALLYSPPAHFSQIYGALRDTPTITRRGWCGFFTKQLHNKREASDRTKANA